MKFKFLLILLIVIFSCSEEEAKELNSKPEIVELTTDNSVVLAGETVTISCEAIDADGDNLTYKWSSDTGALSGNGSEINWTAPNISGNHIIKCIVSDGKGGSTEKSIVIKVEIENAGSLRVSADLTNPLEEGFKVTEAFVKIAGIGNDGGSKMTLSTSKATIAFNDISSGEYEIIIEAYQYQTLIYKGVKKVQVNSGSEVDASVNLIYAQEIIPMDDFYVGVVPADFIARKYFGNDWTASEPLKTLKENGVDWVRVGVTTRSSNDLKSPASTWNTLPNFKDEYWSSVEWAEQIFKEAVAQDMRLNLFFFLSENAAYAWVQDAPADWRSMSVEQTAQVLEDYTYKTTKYFKDKGYNIEIYDIGNEIGAGILNFLPNDRIPLPAGTDILHNMDYMINEVWKVEAILLKAAIKGVRRADNDAKIVIHIAEMEISDNDIFPRTFFETMYLEGVDFDYIGLSYPYVFNATPEAAKEAYFKSSTFKGTLNFLGALGKPIIFSEYSFPHTPSSDFQTPPIGYSYTPSGQEQWLMDFLTTLNSNPRVKGAFYFYPEHFPGHNYDPQLHLEYSGLFKNSTTVLPALKVFKGF